MTTNVAVYCFETLGVPLAAMGGKEELVAASVNWSVA